MSLTYELDTNYGLAKSWYLLDRREQVVFRKLTTKWRRKNKDADLYDQMIFETLVRLHLIEQRLVSFRYTLFDVHDEAEYIKQDRRQNVDSDVIEKKYEEFNKYFPMILKLKAEYLKLAKASKIEITGDISASSLFAALDQNERIKLQEYKSISDNNGNNGTRL